MTKSRTFLITKMLTMVDLGGRGRERELAGSLYPVRTENFNKVVDKT